MNAFNRWIRLAAPALALLFAAPATAEPPSIETFASEAQLVDVDISPDGRKLAVVARNEDAAAAAVYDLVDRSRPPVTMPLESTAPFGVTWANNERLLLHLRNQDRSRKPHIVAIDPDGENAVMLFKEEEKIQRLNRDLSIIVDMLPNDPQHILMPAERTLSYDLWKVDVYTGGVERLEIGDRWTYAWETDISGRPALRFDTNWRWTLIYVHAPDGEGGWRRVKTLERKELPDFNYIAATDAPGVVYTTDRREDSDGRTAIYRYDVLRNQFLERVAAAPDVDVTGAHVDRRTGAFLGSYYWRDRLRHDFVDPADQQSMAALEEMFGDQVNIGLYDRTEDNRRWVLNVSGPQDPGSFYLYDRDAETLELLGRDNPALPADRLSPIEVIHYEARDGLALTAYLTTPQRAGPHKLVVMPHGGPKARSAIGYSRYAQFLASRGYAVLQPNFRGSSGYGEAFENAGAREWGGRMQDDLTDAVRALSARADIDTDHVCIFGVGFGGYAALAGAAFTPEVYDCAVSLGGISDLMNHVQKERRDLDDEAFDFVRTNIGDPRRDADMLKARSPARHADLISVPVLLIHGEWDNAVPISHSRDMRRAIQRAGGVVRFVEVEEMWHTPAEKEHWVVVLTELEAFLAEHLPLN